MNKRYISLGVLALLLSFGIARGEVEISPQSQDACCESASYDVTISNELKTAQLFKLSAEAEEGDIEITLQPDTIKINPGAEETLVMLARPSCGLAPGQYDIRVGSRHTGACEDACGQYCEFTEEDIAVLTIPEDCVAPAAEPEVDGPAEAQKPAENKTEQNRTNESQGTQNQTGAPTGATVAAENDYMPIGVLFVLLGVFIIMLALIQRDSKGSKRQTKKPNFRGGKKK